VVVWVLRNWLRVVMFSGGLEGGYVGAPTMSFLCTKCIKTIKSRRSSLCICLLYLGNCLSDFNDICVNISPLLELPSLVFAVSYNWSLQDSGHVALSLGSDTSITFCSNITLCSNQVVFNYFNTSIQVFL